MLGGFREQLTARCDNPLLFGMCPRICILTWQCRHSLQSFSATAGKIYSDLDPGLDLVKVSQPQSLEVVFIRGPGGGEVMNED